MGKALLEFWGGKKSNSQAKEKLTYPIILQIFRKGYETSPEEPIFASHSLRSWGALCLNPDGPERFSGLL